MDPTETILAPFTYVLVPCDSSQPLSQRRFPGGSEATLKESLTSHFRTRALSNDQRAALIREVTSRCDRPTATVGAPQAGSVPSASGTLEQTTSAVTATSANDTTLADVAAQYASDPSFEIVPVVLPTSAVGYVGASLYIDDAGRFKDLPLNDRASTMAQRDIRGDAFLLQNHDDPALDVWSRVDCPIERAEELTMHPPVAVDARNPTDPSVAARKKEAEARIIDDADVAAAVEAKKSGNAAFAREEFDVAAELFAEAAARLNGRLDLRPDNQELVELRRTSLVNLSLAEYKQRAFIRSANAARTALEIDAKSVKALYRLASALIGAEEWEEAHTTINELAHLGAAEGDVAGLRCSLRDAKIAADARQKKLFSKIFNA